MWLLYVVLLFVFIFILDYFLLDKRKQELVQKLNSPPRIPLIGHAWLFIGSKSNGEFSSKIRIQVKTQFQMNYFQSSQISTSLL